MATATATTSRVEHTPEELLEITDRPMPELIDGQLVERALTGMEADAVAANLLAFIHAFVRAHRLGVVNGAQDSFQIFPNKPKKVLIPDVSFTRRERLPRGGVAQGHSKIAPDLIVEVISPNDLAGELTAKVRDFLSAGVSHVWVASPETSEVFVYRSHGTVSLLRCGDVLDGGDVFPGFQCPVEEIFKIGFND